MIEEIVDAIVGSNGFLSAVGDLLGGVGGYNEGQAAVIDVLKGGHEIVQEWDAEAGAWVNVDQTWSQPIFPWNPLAAPGA